jgi:K(+)-stimulated pyrophosphate-energized sodium pump
MTILVIVVSICVFIAALLRTSSEARRIAGALALLVFGAITAVAQSATGTHQPGGEANLKLPDLAQVAFLGVDGRSLLVGGILVCFLGLGFGLLIYVQLKRLPVHRAMLEISELIYETCKTYLVTQGKFILILEAFIAVIITLYFGFLLKFEALRVIIILFFSLVGIAGSYGVAWFGIRVNTFANSRTAFASLEGKPYPIYVIPLKAGMSIGMMLISVELLLMLCILLFVPVSMRTVFHRVCDWRESWCGSAENCRWHLHQDRRHRF